MRASITTPVNRGLVVRGLWLLAALLAVSIFLASIPALFAGALNPSHVEVSGAWVSVFSAASVLACLASVGVSLLLAALLVLRKSGDRMATFVAFYLLGYGIAMGGPLEALEHYWFGSTSHSIVIMTVLLTAPTFALFGLFPNGRWVPGWTRWLTLIAAAMSLSIPFLSTPEELQTFSTPFTFGYNLALGILITIGVYAQGYRYARVSTRDERQQTKWVLYGIFLWLVLMGLEGIPYVLIQQAPPGTPKPWWLPIGNTAWFLTIGILPVSLTVAILRSHLWDIDLIIRRTLIYGVLITMLATVYYGSVILLQQLVREFTGQQQTDAVIVLSTLASAALFAPLHRRIRSVIDQRFYRRKYDTVKVLAAFSATVRDEVDLNRLNDELLSVVEQTMQPSSVSLWLKETGDGQGTKA